MAMASLPPLLLVLLLLISFTSSLTLAASSPQCNISPDSGSTLHVIHAYGPCSPLQQTPTSSFEDLLLQIDSVDKSRLLYLSSLAIPTRAFVPIASGSQLLQSPTYLIRANLGTPPQSILVALDTSSDAAWIPSSAYVPARSTTYRPVPCGSPHCKQVPNPSCPAGAPSSCSFNLTYGSSVVTAKLAQDSLTLASNVINGYVFGAMGPSSSAPAHGLLGMGRGPLSFLSQSANLYSSTFSYCLPAFRSPKFSGTLRLGTVGQSWGPRMKFTPLLSNPHRSSLYYVSLNRIRVGKTYVTVPKTALAFNPTTGAGTVFDSGTMFTRLVAPAYTAVRDAFRRRVSGKVTSLGGFDTCYAGPLARVPVVTFEFTGMNVSLPAENVMIHSSSGNVQCLAMAAAPENVNSVLNVIASMQQQNMRVLFDVPKGRVGVTREICTAP